MKNYLPRHVEKKLLKYSRQFGAILVTGARQVGKSKLLENVFPEIPKIEFEPDRDIRNARDNPELFLETSGSPLLLDEIQHTPDILPAMKRRIDQNQQSGQYFLTGSQITSKVRDHIKNMTGRIGILELSGMTPAEISGQGDRGLWLEDYLENPEGFFEKYQNTSTIITDPERFLWRGGMPALLQTPDEGISYYHNSYIQTYIENDIRRSENIADLTHFENFIAHCAGRTAQEMSPSFGKDIIKKEFAQKWLAQLKNGYQWFELQPYHANFDNTLRKNKKGYFHDTGLACHLYRISSPKALSKNDYRGALFETWAVNLIRRQALCLDFSPQLYHWRNKKGDEVDLIIDYNGRLFPVEIKYSPNPAKTDLRGLQAFRKEMQSKNDIAPGLILHTGNSCSLINQNTLAIPCNIHTNLQILQNSIAKYPSQGQIDRQL